MQKKNKERKQKLLEDVLNEACKFSECYEVIVAIPGTKNKKN